MTHGALVGAGFQSSFFWSMGGHHSVDVYAEVEFGPDLIIQGIRAPIATA